MARLLRYLLMSMLLAGCGARSMVMVTPSRSTPADGGRVVSTALTASVSATSTPSPRDSQSTASVPESQSSAFSPVQPAMACAPRDIAAVNSSVTTFLQAWNQRDQAALVGLFAPDGWLATRPDPRQPLMTTSHDRQDIGQLARDNWAAGAIFRYTRIPPAEMRPGDTMVGTSVDGLTLVLGDGTAFPANNKFVVWCNAHELGQVMIQLHNP